MSSSGAITPAVPTLNGDRFQISFTVVSSQTNGTIQLLQSDQLGSSWTTNTTASLTTNLEGLSYTYTDTKTDSLRFYRVQLVGN